MLPRCRAAPRRERRRRRRGAQRGGRGLRGLLPRSASILIPDEARAPTEVLAHADQRMYAAKQGGRTLGAPPEHRRAAARLAERTPSSASTQRRRPSCRRRRARRWASTPSGSTTSASPPSCTTSARWRSPTRSSTSPARSTTTSGGSCAAHTLIGERIVAAAPALRRGRRPRPREPRALGRQRATPTAWPATTIPLEARIVGGLPTPIARWPPTAPTARALVARGRPRRASPLRGHPVRPGRRRGARRRPRCRRGGSASRRPAGPPRHRAAVRTSDRRLRGSAIARPSGRHNARPHGPQTRHTGTARDSARRHRSRRSHDVRRRREDRQTPGRSSARRPARGARPSDQGVFGPRRSAASDRVGRGRTAPTRPTSPRRSCRRGTAYVAGFDGRLVGLRRRRLPRPGLRPLWQGVTGTTSPGRRRSPTARSWWPRPTTLYAFPAAGCGASVCRPDWKADLGEADIDSSVAVDAQPGLRRARSVGACWPSPSRAAARRLPAAVRRAGPRPPGGLAGRRRGKRLHRLGRRHAVRLPGRGLRRGELPADAGRRARRPPTSAPRPPSPAARSSWPPAAIPTGPTCRTSRPSPPAAAAARPARRVARRTSARSGRRRRRRSPATPAAQRRGHARPERPDGVVQAFDTRGCGAAVCVRSGRASTTPPARCPRLLSPTGSCSWPRARRSPTWSPTSACSPTGRRAAARALPPLASLRVRARASTRARRSPSPTGTCCSAARTPTPAAAAASSRSPPVASRRRMALRTSVVGSYPQPDWLIDRDALGAPSAAAGARARAVARRPRSWLEQAQDDATRLAIADMERAGIDIVTDGEMRRESYSNRFATALDGVDIDNPGTAIDRTRPPEPGAAGRRPDPAARTRSRCATSSSCGPHTDRHDQDHPARPVHDGPAGPERPLRRRGRAGAGLRRRGQRGGCAT